MQQDNVSGHMLQGNDFLSKDFIQYAFIIETENDVETKACSNDQAVGGMAGTMLCCK